MSIQLLALWWGKGVVTSFVINLFGVFILMMTNNLPKMCYISQGVDSFKLLVVIYDDTDI